MSYSAQLSETKRQLLERFAQGRSGTAAAHPLETIPHRPSGSPGYLALPQREIWLNAQRAAGIPCYNEPITIHRKGSLDIGALERSLAEVVRRHEAWRTTFHTRDGEPIQVVRSAPQVMLPVNDLRQVPEVEREALALQLATQDAVAPFDLERGPLFRARLIQIGDQDYRLHMTVHQIILDGVSVYHVLLPELVTLYNEFSGGGESSLPELPIQYADFAYWQRQSLQGEVLASELAFWRKELAGAPEALPVPTDYPRRATQTFRGAIQPFDLPSELSEQLRTLSRHEGVTLFVTLAGAFIALLHCYTGCEDILVGTVAPAGRKRPGVQHLMGYFLNRVALRTNLLGNPTFHELLQRVRSVVSGALSHDEVPFETVVEHLGPSPDPSRNPYVQLAVSLEPPMPTVDPGWDLTPMDVESGGARLDLYLVLDDRPTGIIGRAQYNPDLFARSTIIRMVEHFRTVLQLFIADPNKQLSWLPRLNLIQPPVITSS